MKIKEGFMLREIAGSWIVVPIGQRVVEFRGLMTLSESGAQLWRKLESGADVEDLVALLMAEYDMDEKTVRDDIREFLSAVGAKGLIA